MHLSVRPAADGDIPSLVTRYERAYRGGAASYLEWTQMQSESTAARRQQLDAAVDAYRALIELQRLTAEPFVVEPDVVEASPANRQGVRP